MQIETQNVEETPNTGFVGIGTSLNWESELQPIQLCVELPFWMLTPSCSLKYQTDVLDVAVTIENYGIEIQSGPRLTQRRANILFVGNDTFAPEALVPLRAVITGTNFRATRTLLILRSHAHTDALNAYSHDQGARFQDAALYFASLAQGHLPIINDLVNAYRSESVDPLCNELTPWDLPVWYIMYPHGPRPVWLQPHQIEDHYPEVYKNLDTRESFPHYATTPDAIARRLSAQMIPGEIDLLDGWSLFYRGRYGESIRSFVTAIEVLLEAQIRRILTDTGSTIAQINQQLDGTKQRFEDRLDLYCRLSNQRLPGPLLNMAPNVNGVRLHNELTRTRELSHRIVHHGHRLDHTFSRDMQRAADTTTWAFDWLTGSGDFERRRLKNLAYFSARNAVSNFFSTKIRDRKIVVQPFFPRSSKTSGEGRAPTIVEDIGRVVHDERILLRTISTSVHDGKDVDHFARMLFHDLGVYLEDSPYDRTSNVIAERYWADIDNRLVWFFVVDADVDVALMRAISAYVDSRRIGSNDAVDRICIIWNHEGSQPWKQRTWRWDSEIDKLATEIGVSVCRTSDLARLFLGARKYSWPLKQILVDVLEPGLRAISPPNGRLLGHTYRYWSKPEIIGVQVNEDTSFERELLVALRLPDGFRQSRMVDFRRHSNNRLTFRMSMPRRDFRVDAELFALSEV